MFRNKLAYCSIQNIQMQMRSRKKHNVFLSYSLRLYLRNFAQDIFQQRYCHSAVSSKHGISFDGHVPLVPLQKQSRSGKRRNYKNMLKIAPASTRNNAI